MVEEKRPWRKAQEKDVDQMVELYARGFGIRDVAALLGFSYGTTHSRLKERGVLRTMSSGKRVQQIREANERR
jgi:hypothetical protein